MPNNNKSATILKSKIIRELNKPSSEMWYGAYLLPPFLYELSKILFKQLGNNKLLPPSINMHLVKLHHQQDLLDW